AVSASASVEASRDAFYAEARFGDVFVHCKRAPRAVLERLRGLPGVAAVDGRVVDDFPVVMAESAEPVVLRFVSLAGPADAAQNQLRIMEGRRPRPGSSEEVVVSQSFAETWRLAPGSSFQAVVNGRLARLRIVGTGVSPEFVWATDPRKGMPDPWHYGIA